MGSVFQRKLKKIARTPSTAKLEAENIGEKYHDYEFPKLSIVIPTYNNATSLDLTLDRIMIQEYPDLEIIIVDAGSTDGTLEIVRSYRDDRILIATVSSYQRAEMLNKGISQAVGSYINFLFPGDYYIYKETLKFMMALALDHHKPQLLFCGTLIRDGKNEPKVNFSHLSLRLLRMGEQPTALQSCWFRSDTFDIVGKFDPDYKLRTGYEWMCRFALAGDLKALSCRRILIDYERKVLSKNALKNHFMDTFFIIYRYFGALATIKWLFVQRDWMNFLKVWWRSLKYSIVGK